jgi:hypothetical protein
MLGCLGASDGVAEGVIARLCQGGFMACFSRDREALHQPYKVLHGAWCVGE